MNKLRHLISYYGGKSKVAHLYPKPRFSTIVEPFAGGASYSLRYYERDIHLNDIDSRTVNLWRFLLSPDAREWIERYVPVTVHTGQNILEIFPPGCSAPPGLIELVRSEASQGTFGANADQKQVTAFGARAWNRNFRARLDYWIPKIAHWTLTKGGYTQLANRRATWFIDPPYNNAAGRQYRHHAVNYLYLAQWCRARDGEVIVCEHRDAMWLPFSRMINRYRGMRHDRKNDADEAMYYSFQEI